MPLILPAALLVILAQSPPADASAKLEAGSWKLDAGSWKLEAGSEFSDTETETGSEAESGEDLSSLRARR